MVQRKKRQKMRENQDSDRKRDEEDWQRTHAGSGSSSGKKIGKRKRGKGTLAVLTVSLFFLIFAGLAGVSLLFRYQEGGAGSSAAEASVDLDGLYSPYAVLIDEESGDVLGSKRSDERIYPASMTKILTVSVAIESIRDLDAAVTLSPDIFDELYEEDASQAGFEPGETTTVRDLLYGALLPSGAECCVQLAIKAAGSQEAMVEKMNRKAAKLGLTNSHFTNCTGLHNEDQYTTAYEMAMILRSALENETFRTVFTTHFHVMADTNLHPDGFTVWSTFFQSVEEEEVTGGEILGAKTGYTQEAGLCLASMAELYGKEYILVTAGWCGEEDAGNYHIADAFTAYDLLGEVLGS